MKNENKEFPASSETQTTTASPDPVKVVIVPTTEEETVTLKKSELENIMDRLKRVEFAAEKSRLAKFDERSKGAKGKTVKLRTIDGKVVLSWDDMLINNVEKNPQSGVWHEEQRIRIRLEDKSTQEMDLVIFNRHFIHLEADVISESKLLDSNDIILKVKTDDGREYEVNNKFIN